MPRLSESSDRLCEWCGNPATFVSVNSKKYRCQEKINKCPGVVQKQEQSRKSRMTQESRIAHMKKMSEKGNSRLKELHSDTEWISQKGGRISNRVKERGGHTGSNNPMFGKKHSPETIERLKKRAQLRDPNCYALSTNTKISRGLAISKEQKSDYEIYEEKVDNITRQSWLSNYWRINPDNLQRGKDYELDHKYSKTEGWINNVPPEIIGHWCNLEVLPKSANRSKRTKCSITLEELITAISSFPRE